MTPKQRNSMLKIWINLRWSTIMASILLPRHLRPVLLPNQHGLTWKLHKICPMAGLLSDITCGQHLGCSEGLGRL